MQMTGLRKIRFVVDVRLVVGDRLFSNGVKSTGVSSRRTGLGTRELGDVFRSFLCGGAAVSGPGVFTVRGCGASATSAEQGERSSQNTLLVESTELVEAHPGGHMPQMSSVVWGTEGRVEAQTDEAITTERVGVILNGTSAVVIDRKKLPKPAI